MNQTDILELKVLNKLARQFSNDLDHFVKHEQLDQNFKADFKTYFLPLAVWINNQHLGTPLIIGVNGAQGSGKTTLCKLLVQIIGKLFNKTVLHLSIDDLYYSRNKRLSLSKAVHSLLNIRGVPGTHNVDLGLSILSNIKNQTIKNINLPVFDKSIDDVLSSTHWKPIPQNIDIVLFEGWCVGAVPQTENALKSPINKLEETEDIKGHWRQYVNDQLSNQYKALFSHIDYLIMLKAPNMECVFEWRNLQETKLKNTRKNNQRMMSENEIKHFIMYFERITRHCLQEMPARASVLLNLNIDHQITDIKFRDH